MNRIFPWRFEIFANLGLLLTGMESRRKPINRPMLAGELNLASRRIAVPVKNGHDHRPNGGILRTGLPSPHLDSIGLCGVIEKHQMLCYGIVTKVLLGACRFTEQNKKLFFR